MKAVYHHTSMKMQVSRNAAWLALQEALGLQGFVPRVYHPADHLTITCLSPCVHTPHTPCDDQQGLILALAARPLSISQADLAAMKPIRDCGL